ARRSRRVESQRRARPPIRRARQQRPYGPLQQLRLSLRAGSALSPAGTATMPPDTVSWDESLDLDIRDARWGRLGPLTFPSLIHNVCDERNTGVLTVKDGDIEKRAYVDRGRIVFATSNLHDDRLGNLL